MNVSEAAVYQDISTKERIFKAAARLFAEKGYNGVSMRELSEASAISKPTIYYHFGNKEGVYSTLIEVGMNYQWDKFLMIMKKDIPIRRKLVEIIKIRFSQVLDYPEMAKFFIILFISPEKLPFLERFIREAATRRQQFVALITEGIHSGEFGKSANPELAAEIIMGAMLHFILRQINEKSLILDERLAEQIVEIIFKGLNE